jgi:biopolymer transport protein ExbB/TolQ
MLAWYFEAGGPVMWVVFGTWVIVLAGVLDRIGYALVSIFRRPLRPVDELARAGRHDEARRQLATVRQEASRGLDRIDSVSQIATSIGLFGTVLGLASSFFARGSVDLSLAAPEVLAEGLSTALFTTLGGLVVYLFGQAFLIAWREWSTHRERVIVGLLPREVVE